jgi:hypothetical protein
MTNGKRTEDAIGGAGASSGSGQSKKGVTNGFVNGAGAVNGFRLSYQQRKLKVADFTVAKKLIVVSLLVALIVALPYALVYAFPKETVSIDGYFMDWLKVQMYHDVPDSSNPDISISDYAMKYDARGTYFYLDTQGQLFSGRGGGADGFYIFVDRDGNALTGYSVHGLGADACIELIGWNSSLAKQSTYLFDPDSNSSDFGGFHLVSEPSVAFYGSQMEVGEKFSASANSKVAIQALHTNMSGDWTDVNFRAKGPSIAIMEDQNGPSIISNFSEQRVMTITVAGKGAPSVLDGLKFDFLGNVTPMSMIATNSGGALASSYDSELLFYDPISLKADSEISFDVLVRLPSTPLTGSFGLELNRTHGVVAGPNVTWLLSTIQTGARVAYLGSPPSSVVVDGAFGDWSSRMGVSDVLGDAYSNITNDDKSGDVDIATVKAASTVDVASFYMSVNGTMLCGSSVPKSMVRFAIPSGPAGNVTNITQSMYGADFAFVFIDIDGNQSTGSSIGGAEAAISIIGKDNSIISSRVYRFVNDTWNDVGPADAAIDQYQLEVSGAYSALGLVSGEAYTVTFLTEDWSGRQDDARMGFIAHISSGTKAWGGIIINELFSKGGPQDWIELMNTASTSIDISGYRLYASGVLVYTWPAGTVIGPGQLLLTSNLEFGKSQTYQLRSSSGALVDQVSTPVWQEKSYGRTGAPPYSTWASMASTPGALNVGQTPIPEFGSFIVPLAIVPIIMIAFRHSKRVEGPPEEE